MAPPLSELSDSALWVRYVQLGDERSIKVLQERYAKRFMAFVVEKVIDRADAEDILGVHHRDQHHQELGT